MGLKQLWIESRYRKRVEEWGEEVALAGKQLEKTLNAYEGAYTSRRARLEAGERLCSEFDASLSETRRVRVTDYGSFSHTTHGGNRVRAGRAQSTSHDELQVIDNGTVVITDRRVQFLGSKHNRELRWRTLADNPQAGRGSMTFRSSGRQKPLVITFHPSGTEEVRFDVDLALKLFDGGGASRVADLTRVLKDVLSSPPATPEGVEVDERVRAIKQGMSDSNSAPPPPGVLSSAPAVKQTLSLPIGCFVSTPVEQVMVAALSAGFSTRWLSWPGNESELSASGPHITTPAAMEKTEQLGVVLDVIAGDGDQVLKIWEHVRPEHCLFVTSAAVEGVSVLDAGNVECSVLFSDVEQADLILSARPASKMIVHRVTCDRVIGAEIFGMFSSRAAILRAIGRKSQVLVLTGPSEYLPDPMLFSGFDEAIVVNTDPAADAPDLELVDDAVEPEVVEREPITVAGSTIAKPAAHIMRYILEHARTVRRYDLTAGTYQAVTPELIAATRVLSSRISEEQANWLIERGTSAPWELVPHGSKLADADPCLVGGLYDAASTLYAHFRATAPKGIKAAKIYKALHLMRPAMFPILDSRLARKFDDSAAKLAPLVNACRSDLQKTKRAYWAAIREDLLANSVALASIRETLRSVGDPLITEAVASMSDVRLLDILTWVDADNDADVDPEDV